MKCLRVVALVITLGMAALVATAPGVSAAPSGGDPVEVFLEGGDPFEAVTAQATLGTAVGAVLITLVYGLLGPIAAILDTVFGGGGFPLANALHDAARAACIAIGGTPGITLSPFPGVRVFTACSAL